MEAIIFTIFACILPLTRDKNLLLENLALRQQLAIMKQKKWGQVDNAHAPFAAVGG